jgi:hypothetical protein
MLILSEPTVNAGRLVHNLASMRPHPRFVDEMLHPLMAVALFYGIDPVVPIAQSLKETDRGHFTRAVLPTFHNPAGIKIHNPALAGPDQEVTLAHAQFASWEIGAHAHCQHLMAYLQSRDFDCPIIDPRWVHVFGKKTAITDVEHLGGPGSWAPSLTYGQEIRAIIDKLASKTWVMP